MINKPLQIYDKYTHLMPIIVVFIILYKFYNFSVKISKQGRYLIISNPELVPRLYAPASIIFKAASLSLIPPEAFTFKP